MSGALEVAASAFAVVGVADVLVRTGREFYSFLGEVADAPEEIDRLREVIRTTVLLYHNSRRCQQDLKTRGASTSAADVTSSLESATKALDRELRELSKTAKKYNGIKTWGNVKFVLGKDRVNKAIQRLEHAKTLMANALTLACIELLALGLTDVKTVMLKCFEDAGLKTDRVYQALVAKIDAQHQDALVLHNHQKALTSKIDKNQRNQLLNQDRHQRTLRTTQRTQVEILRRQDASMRVAKGTQQQTSSILRAVTHASMKAGTDRHEKTAILDTIATDIKQLISLNDGSLLVDQSHRTISFLGECQDRIMAYLLPFQDDIEFAIDSLISQHGHEISTSDAEFLRSELQHLVGSAAQEKALQHPGSAAKSFDRWSYPQDTVGFLKNSAKNRTSSGYSYSTDGEKITSTRQMTGPGKRWALSSRTFKVQTPSGPVDITMPRSREAGEDIHETAEAGISYVVTQNCSSVHVNTHFVRHLARAGQPRIYAHLNVFTVVDDATVGRYNSKISFDSTPLAEFDTALRQGIISPFHVDRMGNNICLLLAVLSLRFDLLDYLESQGIGQTALRQDSSLTVGIYIGPRYKLSSIIGNASSRAADPLSFLLEVAFRSLFELARGQEQDEILNTCNRLLRNEGEQSTEHDWSCLSIPQMLQHLIELGAPIEKPFFGGNAIHSSMWSKRVNEIDYTTFVEMLSILIKHGVGRHDLGVNGLTPSMLARVKWHWAAWCEALERNNLRIEDVLEKEANTWLLDDNWKVVWRDRLYFRWEYLDTNFVDDIPDIHPVSRWVTK